MNAILKSLENIKAAPDLSNRLQQSMDNLFNGLKAIEMEGIQIDSVRDVRG